MYENERVITKEDIEYARNCLKNAKVQPKYYPIKGYWDDIYFEIDIKGNVMTDSYNISGLLLASIEQVLCNLNVDGQSEVYVADHSEVLREVQAMLRGDTDGDQEEGTDSPVEASGDAMAEAVDTADVVNDSK